MSLGFLHSVRVFSGSYDQGAVGGAGEPSGSSVLLSPRSIPKDKGGVPWAPSPPVTASGIIHCFIVLIQFYPRDLVWSSKPYKNRQWCASLVFEGGGGRRVGVFFSREVVSDAVLCCMVTTSFFRVFFSRHLMKPVIWCLIQAMFPCRAGRGF